MINISFIIGSGLCAKKCGFIVYLNATADCIYERTKSAQHRPLLNVSNPRDVISSLLKIRDPLYRAIANIVIDVNDLTIDEIVDTIIK